ncbi:MAG: type II toxin-antitoxin system HicA family toxin [Bacteroidales bacterium]|jgi:mRNA interferase HicA|nr:type II toxin-antitoxin system HicA family toxin [Bacteroidales bacterium]
MKYTEFHRLIKKNGWLFIRAEGSHYFYSKDGKLSQPVPYHGSKEIGEGLRKKLVKELQLK